MSADGSASLVAHLITRTEAGVGKSRNEDSIGIAGRLGVLRQGAAVEFRGAVSTPLICVVADGAGGHPAGDQASRLVVTKLLNRSPEVRSSEQLEEAIVHVHGELQAAMQREQEMQGMGSTVAVLALGPDGVLTANVGDSGIFEIDPQGVLALSVADNPSGAAPDGSSSSAATLTQMLGGPAGMAPPKPHLGRYPLEEGMRFLVCSDGLTNALPETEIDALIRDRSPGDAEVANELVETAIRAGAQDDVSVVLASVTAESME